MKNIFAKPGVFLEMIKFEHSIFALPFAYVGLFMAEKKVPGFFVFAWVTIAMVSFRTTAMSLNRILDAAIDARNPRTRLRALPSGKLNKATVWAVAIVSFLVFETSAYQLGMLCLLLTPVPVILAFIYPLMKKVSWLSHFVLGAVLGIAPYGAWIACRGTFDLVPALLSLGVLFWVAGFDMIYALQDVEFDRAEKLHSFPAAFGQDLTLAASKILHLLSVILWALAGYFNGSGTAFFVGVLLAALFLNREYRLVRSFGVAKLNEAFFFMNAVVSIMLFLATVFDITLKGSVL
ncbi:MAG: UbiA-like polyprenyltransferase [Candidatus Omnitrophota bacterium]|jgi:4-hydroxybenzoate polyprenyltransferase